MKEIYIVQRYLWDQWDHYGEGTTEVLKVFSNEEKAEEFLKSIDVFEDFSYELDGEYKFLKPFELVDSSSTYIEYHIDGPIGDDVRVIYSIETMEVE